MRCHYLTLPYFIFPFKIFPFKSSWILRLLQSNPSGALRPGSGLKPRSSDILAGFVTGRGLCEPQGRHGDCRDSFQF